MIKSNERMVPKALLLLCVQWVLFSTALFSQTTDSRIVSHTVDLNQDTLQFFLQDNNGKNYGSIGRLKSEVESKGKKLIFAMNGGMYLEHGSPQGLYVENGTEIKSLDKTQNAYGNFYMQPNGVFYITKSGKGRITVSAKYDANNEVKYATQSGPMLVIEGELHAKFNEGSQNIHIRNGVGILPNGNLLFAISTERVNLYDFATFFLEAGCKQALYLDGFVSKAYIPELGLKQLEGNFGVIIGVTE